MKRQTSEAAWQAYLAQRQAEQWACPYCKTPLSDPPPVTYKLTAGGVRCQACETDLVWYQSAQPPTRHCRKQPKYCYSLRLCRD